ncbi:MAG: M23 family metallopeptidase, partial [Geminicoccaceae bacterium]
MYKIAAVLFAVSMSASGLAMTGAAMAAMPELLQLPIDCKPGQNCWVVRYVDHEPGPGVKDYACGNMTGDGHKGTD